MKILKRKGGVIMENRIKIRMNYLVLGILIAACFFMFTGFRLPGAQESGGSYQFYKEKDSSGVWVFEPDTGSSKYFDVEKGVVIINSFPMDTISVKTNIKTIEQKG
jgi:hypothetical protein